MVGVFGPLEFLLICLAAFAGPFGSLIHEASASAKKITRKTRRTHDRL
jgi:hypothetical protein